MPKLALIVPALLIAAGCAAHRSEVAPITAEAASQGAAPVIPVAEDTATAAAPLPENIKAVEISEFENELVCESRKRTGTTRISRQICYSRAEYAAMQAAKEAQAERYLDELAREQEQIARQQQAMEEQQRRALASGP